MTGAVIPALVADINEAFVPGDLRTAVILFT